MSESTKHVLVSGGTGFVGSRVVELLQAHGHRVNVVSRTPGPGRCTLDSLPDNFDAVVNLAGAKVDKRWTTTYKQELFDSRVGVTEKLKAAAEQRGASAFISGSAIGWYGNRGDEVCTEESAPGDTFLAKLAREWEQAAQSTKLRVVTIRTGIVLHRSGGALAKMIPLFRWFMGGRLGNGRQYLSWIHRDDIAALFVHCLENDVRGAVNGTGPNPATNREFTKALATAVHRPVMPPVPGFALRLLYGEMADMLLLGQRVVPVRAQQLGFTFKYPELAAALEAAVHG